MSTPTNSGAAVESVPKGFTAEDLRLGKKAVRVKTFLCVAAIVACAAIAAFVFAHVPGESRMPYDGKYNRSGTGIPMQIAMLPCLLVLFGFWRTGKKPDAHHMGQGSRAAYYVIAPAIILGCVVGQWVMAESILEAGGYFG